MLNVLYAQWHSNKPILKKVTTEKKGHGASELTVHKKCE